MPDVDFAPVVVHAAIEKVGEQRQLIAIARK